MNPAAQHIAKVPLQRIVARHYDPRETDRKLLLELFKKYGGSLTKGRQLEEETLIRDTIGSSYTRDARQPAAHELEDFAAAGIEKLEDIRSRWIDNFYFGSERTIAR